MSDYNFKFTSTLLNDVASVLCGIVAVSAFFVKRSITEREKYRTNASDEAKSVSELSLLFSDFIDFDATTPSSTGGSVVVHCDLLWNLCTSCNLQQMVLQVT